MSQTTLDDDDLFGEAAGELRTDVEACLENAWEALPDPERMWSAEADNVLGVLNTLRTTLDTEEAHGSLRDAKKWFTIGQRAGAFDADGDLATDVEALEATIAEIEKVREEVGSLASTLPQLRNRLRERAEPAPTPAAGD